ncbi:MAG: hypothetical protein KC635_23500, partial [Myxococcales bacterium]|nr:hypothetical protein [Myxococcales bacterium]
MMLRHAPALGLALLLVAAPALVACGDDGGHNGSVGDTATAPDSAGDDATTGDDVADTVAEDTTPLPEGPLAKVYPVSPTETPDLEEVELAHLTSTDGTLVGEFARVRACVRDLEAGTHIPLDLGGFSLDITACAPEFSAHADARGTYLDIAPPASPEEDDGKFAEIMMYHHMQVVHDYFKGVHGLTDRDSPLDALTNLQAFVDLCEQWAPFPNAAFIPRESISELPFGIGDALDLKGDAIVFSGTDVKNFAFDASVIYHEYTHSILGATRLNGVFFDEQGLNNLPGALNEAYA